MTNDELNAIKERAEKARATVYGLCDGTIRWRMHVPARPESDPDLVIADSLKDVSALAAEIERLQTRLKEIKADVQEVEWNWNRLPPNEKTANNLVSGLFASAGLPLGHSRLPFQFRPQADNLLLGRVQLPLCFL